MRSNRIKIKLLGIYGEIKMKLNLNTLLKLQLIKTYINK